MKLRIARIAVVALAAAVAAGSSGFAGAPKQLENQKGTVFYQKPNAPQQPIALNASVDLLDEDYSITGDQSLAQLTLPDSSQVTMGSDTKVQLAFFNQTDIANAKFVLYNGKTRFAVRHPQGAKANYTFQTATGTVGVRGTQGDIEYDPSGNNLRVNVYEVCDPNNPVTFLAGGKSFTVIAGQSLQAQLVNGVVRASVEKLTQQLINQFSPEFGVPTSWDAAKGEVISYASNQAASAAGPAGSYASQAVTTIGGMFKKKATPAPAPAKSSSCS